MTIDTVYKDALRYVLKNGRLHEDSNRLGTYRLNVPYLFFGVPINSVPAISIKKSFPGLAMKELSLFMRGKTDIRVYWDAGVNFWDKDWYNFNGHKNNASLIDIKDHPYDYDYFDLGKIYPYQYRNFGGSFDQMESLLYKMIHRPMSSDLVVSAWNPADEKDMCLKPCHFQFNVAMERLGMVQNGYGFHLSWTQRSTDLFLGTPMNTMFYFYLGKILERITGHRFLSLTGHLFNAHLYDNAIDLAKDVVINRPKHLHKLSQLKFHSYLTEEFTDYKSFWDNLPLDAVKLTEYDSYRHYACEMKPYGTTVD